MKRLLFICGIPIGCVLMLGAMSNTIPDLQTFYQALSSLRAGGSGQAAVEVLFSGALTVGVFLLGLMVTTVCVAKITPPSPNTSSPSPPSDGEQPYDY